MTTAAPRVLTGRRVALIALAFFLTFLIPNIVLMWTAIGTFSGLVVSDSYTASQQFDRLRAAQMALGWTVEVDQADDVLAIGITDAYGQTIRPATLAVTVGRPTTSRSDQPLVLEATPDGYAAHAPLAPGSWRVEISATADGRHRLPPEPRHPRPPQDRPMTDAALAACPACAAAPDTRTIAGAAARAPAQLRRIDLSLPAIHCAACIAGVERTLDALPGVAAARVNLTLKRASVTAEDAPGLEGRLIAALAARGYEARPLDSAALEATRTDAEGRDLLARIAVAGFASMNVMLLSVAVWSGAEGSTRDLMHWLSAAIALPAVAFAAQPFFRNGLRALAAGRLDIDVPISTAILLALAVSLRETMLSGPSAFFEAALMLTFFLLVGRYLAHLTRAGARSAAAEIAALEVRTAERIAPDGSRATVPLDAVRPGDILAVAPGARIPVDGTVTAGRSEIDPSLLTGETMPEPVAPGATVHAGMLNLSGPIELRADALGEDTLLGAIGRLVETAERSRGRYASLADRASRAYSPVVYVLALAALLGWGVAHPGLAPRHQHRRRRPHRHLPLRARPRGAGGPDRRLRPPLPRGHPAQGRRGAGEARGRRRRRPRQDRHADHRPAHADQRR